MEPTTADISPVPRASILGNLLRGRPRGLSQSHTSNPNITHDRDSPPLLQGLNSSSRSPGPNHRRQSLVVPANNNTPNLNTTNNNQPQPSAPTGGLSQMLRRRRSAGALANSTTPQTPAVVSPRMVPHIVTASSNRQSHRIRLVPHLDSRRSLRFEPISRDVKEGDPALRIGRFTDRSGLGITVANSLSSNKLAFKSKVVSRAHAEIWAETGGKFWIKDTKSSSGTFLNHVRLSAANSESRPFEIKDGDVLQLGVDYQGGTEDIYKCVKIKIEVGREWQATPNAFNTNAIKQLRALSGTTPAAGSVPTRKISTKSAMADCCICLFAVTINQALFIAPCSHAFHYKCLRPLLESNHPAFSCPLCRTFADLEEDVEVEVDPELDITEDDEEERGGPKTAVPDGKNSTGFPSLPGATGNGMATVATAAAIIRSRRELEDALAAGAETEVEADIVGGSRLTRIGVSRWQGRTPVMPGAMIVDLTEAEDEDEDMMDMRNRESASPSPVMGVNTAMEALGRDLSLSPDPAYGGPSGSRVESGSEGEVGSYGEESHLHAKRKR